MLWYGGLVVASQAARNIIMMKGKDFKKAVTFIKEFLLKLPDDVECAELRDSLNLSLVHMKKYFKTVWLQSQDKDDSLLASSLPRGMSSVTPHQDTPDVFYWKWINVDSSKVVRASLPLDGKGVSRLPLILQAAKEDDHQLIEQLLQKEPLNVQHIDDRGRTALMYATHFNHMECLSKLLTYQTDINYQAHDGSTAMHMAVHDGNYRALELLLQNEACVDIQDSQGRVPLHWAVAISETHCLELLLKCKDIRVNTHDAESLTPAMWACHMDNKRHFELLISSENNIIEESDGIERDASGRTWIHWAVRKEPPLQCLTSLLSPETSAMQDSEGKTVIHTASEKGALEACRIIHEIGGDSCLNAVDLQSRTCLHLAAMAAHGEVLNFLLEKGADLYAKDKFNATAWDYASNRDLHYCKLILGSFEKNFERRDGKSKHRNLQNMEESSEVNNNRAKLSGNTSVSPTPPNRPHPKVQIVPSQTRGGQPRGAPTPQAGSAMDKEPDDGEDSGDGSYHMEDMEGAVISSDMQPSDQALAMEGVEQANDDSPREENFEGSKRLVRLESLSSDSSEQSINIGMNVSDCDEEGADNLERRVVVAHADQPLQMTVTDGQLKSPKSSISSINPEHQALPPRPCSPAPTDKLHQPYPLPLPPPLVPTNSLTQAMPLQPLKASSSPRLIPLENVSKDRGKEAAKSKRKKTRSAGGDKRGQPVTPRSVSPSQLGAPQGPLQSSNFPRAAGHRYPLQPPNVLYHADTANSKNHQGYPTTSRLSPSRGSQQITSSGGGPKTRSRESAWEVSWEPRQPLSPTIPHSPREMQQHHVGLPLANIHQLPNANDNRQGRSLNREEMPKHPSGHGVPDKSRLSPRTGPHHGYRDKDSPRHSKDSPREGTVRYPQPLNPSPPLRAKQDTL